MQIDSRLDQLTSIAPVSLSEIAGERLRKLILSGDLPPGSRLIERELAERLGISRTPIREALFGLEDQGLVISSGRSLMVAPLSVDEIAEIYPMIAALERAAVREIHEMPANLLVDLKLARKRAARAGADVRQLVEADAAWHQALIDPAGNRRLVESVEHLRSLVNRYELVFFTIGPALSRSRSEHESVEILLKQRKMRAAADAVEEHWLGNLEQMKAAIASRQ